MKHVPSVKVKRTRCKLVVMTMDETTAGLVKQLVGSIAYGKLTPQYKDQYLMINHSYEDKAYAQVVRDLGSTLYNALTEVQSVNAAVLKSKE